MRIPIPGGVLREWTSDDASSLVQHANNPKIAAMMRDVFPSPFTRTDAERFLTMVTGSSGILFLAIEIDGEAVGGIGVHPLEDVRKRTAEMGYWLSESFWGRGIVTSSVRAMIPVAFREFDIVRLQTGIFSCNPASMRVLEKCGFIREAVHKKAILKNGMIHDEILYVHFG